MNDTKCGRCPEPKAVGYEYCLYHAGYMAGFRAGHRGRQTKTKGPRICPDCRQAELQPRKWFCESCRKARRRAYDLRRRARYCSCGNQLKGRQKECGVCASKRRCECGRFLTGKQKQCDDCRAMPSVDTVLRW